MEFTWTLCSFICTAEQCSQQTCVQRFPIPFILNESGWKRMKCVLYICIVYVYSIFVYVNTYICVWACCGRVQGHAEGSGLCQLTNWAFHSQSPAAQTFTLDTQREGFKIYINMSSFFFCFNSDTYTYKCTFLLIEYFLSFYTEPSHKWAHENFLMIRRTIFFLEFWGTWWKSLKWVVFSLLSPGTSL